MPLHTPSAWTFWLSVVLAVLAVISRVALIPHLAQYAGWIASWATLFCWRAALSRRSEAVSHLKRTGLRFASVATAY